VLRLAYPYRTRDALSLCKTDNDWANLRGRPQRAESSRIVSVVEAEGRAFVGFQHVDWQPADELAGPDELA
jgi:hypothetical protein